ncbi:MAG: hypothetical protein JXA94_05525 [Parachlamydiales bacterium]|nr:hypothetical protein [Parachlamydiales bacterium]
MDEKLTDTITKELIPLGYKEFLNDLKEMGKKAQIKAVINVNRELILGYWKEYCKYSKKMNFYLFAIDDLVKQDTDNPSIKELEAEFFKK